VVSTCVVSVIRATGKMTRISATSSVKQKVAKGARYKVLRRLHTWSEEDMKSAITAVCSGIMSERKASHMYSVPRSTLQQRLNGKREVEPDDGQTQLAIAKPGHFPFQNSSSPGLTYNNTLQSRSMFLLLSNDVIFDNN
jgi:hypothetical protein